MESVIAPVNERRETTEECAHVELVLLGATVPVLKWEGPFIQLEH